MTEYYTFNTTLSPNQKAKLRRAKKYGRSQTITIKTTEGPDELQLTKTQLTRLGKRLPSRITLSETQMQHQTGGFLGAIIPLLTKALPTIAKLGLAGATGAISGLADRATSGRGTGSGLYADPSGKGLFADPSGSGGGWPILLNQESVKNILNTMASLESKGLIQKGSLDGAMKDIESQRGGFLGTLLAGLAAPLISSIISGLGGKK